MNTILVTLSQKLLQGHCTETKHGLKTQPYSSEAIHCLIKQTPREMLCHIYTLMMLVGLVQLEALESLNSTSEQKVRQFMEMLTKDAAESLKSELLQIRQVFDDVQASTDDGQLLARLT